MSISKPGSNPALWVVSSTVIFCSVESRKEKKNKLFFCSFNSFSSIPSFHSALQMLTTTLHRLLQAGHFKPVVPGPQAHRAPFCSQTWGCQCWGTVGWVCNLLTAAGECKGMENKARERPKTLPELLGQHQLNTVLPPPGTPREGC